MVFLNLGCGEELIRRPGWVNVDMFNPLPGILPIELCDIRKLPYDSGSVDRIVASQVLEHLENPIDGLREWYRVLKPGGTILIAVPDNNKRNEWIGDHIRAFEERKGREHLEAHHIDYVPETLVGAMNEVGPWSELRVAHPKEFWELISKQTWQIIVEGTK